MRSFIFEIRILPQQFTAPLGGHQADDAIKKLFSMDHLKLVSVSLKAAHKSFAILLRPAHDFLPRRHNIPRALAARSFQTAFPRFQETRAPTNHEGSEKEATYKKFLLALHEKDVEKAVRYYQLLRDSPLFSRISHTSQIIRFFRLVQREVRQYPQQCADALHLIRQAGLNLDTKAQKGEALIAYAKLGDYEGALAFAKTMLPANESSSVFIYNQLIAAAGKDNLPLALDQYESIKKTGLRPDQFTYNMLFKFCKAQRDLDTLKKLHSEMVQYDILPNHITSSSLLDGYLKCSEIQAATELFDEMAKKFMLEGFVFNSIITGCVRAGLLEKARAYKDQMIARKMTPDSSTYQAYIKAHLSASHLDEAYESLHEMFVGNITPHLGSVNGVLSACLRNPSPVMALEIYRQMLRCKLQPNTATYNYLFNILAKTSKDIKQILKIYDEMKALKVPLDITTFNALILAFTRMNRFDYVMAKYSELLLDGLQPDIYTYGMLILAYSRNGDMDKATSLFEEMRRRGIPPNVTLFNTLIDGYGRDLNFHKARELLEQMKVEVPPTSQTYNILMNAYLKQGDNETVIKMYEEMRSAGLVPNNHVYTTLMKCHACQGQHDEVTRLWELILASSDPAEDITPSASVMLHSYYDSTRDQSDQLALSRYWDSLKRQLRGRVTVDLYNTYIFLLCSIGRHNDAVAVITHEMDQCGIQPNIKVLQALLNRLHQAKKPEAKSSLLGHLRHSNPALYQHLQKSPV
ncbi:TPR-like protein [Basidiobolus meristosporus CBS 931.73]|uniref:TPR-like protein n=1 Tax=Basidiobolus meristosporus CBS 931.73 TaxID=1314790 RepID=A0A1Y1Y4W5_9FUNG|nr:TPR-like protein [Basidiobolus meristosporus CBS 931.73]|eukprot:ORX93071.1 TPR-like protein [Basidiobolus meristosporus CBS 931.73]